MGVRSVGDQCSKIRANVSEKSSWKKFWKKFLTKKPERIIFKLWHGIRGDVIDSK
jgi:hypothetical protein